MHDHVVMREPAEILNVLLSHCQGSLDEKAVAANDGFQIYVIHLPTLDLVIEAKRSSKVAYTYIIRSYDRKFKRYASSLMPPQRTKTPLALVKNFEQKPVAAAPVAIGRIALKGR